jgi:glycoprotein-N-acetylgalactosamine 3-beta-galactosyltransferase
MTNPANHAYKATAVRDTWGQYCDILLFATTRADPLLNGTVVLDLMGASEQRELLWTKSKMMWMHSYHNYIDKAEWFFRADDGEKWRLI